MSRRPADPARSAAGEYLLCVVTDVEPAVLQNRLLEQLADAGLKLALA